MNITRTNSVFEQFLPIKLLFGDSHRIGYDYIVPWLEENIGPGAPIDVTKMTEYPHPKIRWQPIMSSVSVVDGLYMRTEEEAMMVIMRFA